MDILQGGPLPNINKWSYFTPMNGLIAGFAWGYNPYKWPKITSGFAWGYFTRLRFAGSVVGNITNKIPGCR